MPWGRSVQANVDNLGQQYGQLEARRRGLVASGSAMAEGMPAILERTSELLYLEMTPIPEFEYTFVGGGGVQAVQFSTLLGVPDVARVRVRQRRSIGSLMLEVAAERVSGGNGAMLSSPDCAATMTWTSSYFATVEGGVGVNNDPSNYYGQVVFPFSMPGVDVFPINSYYAIDASFSADPGTADMLVRFTNCKVTYIRTGDISPDDESA